MNLIDFDSQDRNNPNFLYMPGVWKQDVLKDFVVLSARLRYNLPT